MKRRSFSIQHRIAVALAALVGLFIFLGYTWNLAANGPAATPGVPEHHRQTALQGQAAIEHLKQQGQYESLAAAMKAARYNVHESAGGRDEFYANNPAQQYQAVFSPEGVEMRAAGESESNWRVGLKLRSVGYGARQLTVSAGQLSSSGNRVEYERSFVNGPQPSTIKEWYLNRADGLEQGFTLAEPPGERGAGERLRVAMKLVGDLQARDSSAGQAIELVRASGEGVLRYEHLVVTDAQGRKLAATMGTDAGQIWLEVDDAEAVYPVTIDPTFMQQAKLIASDGAADDFFGNAVAISGDTAVVGAWLDDLGTTTDQGSAYVFVRSGTTWSQQQKLTSNEVGTGGFFGEAVAISGEIVVVGASGYGGFDYGAAYVFVRSGTTWSQQQKLTGDLTFSNQFGRAVAIDGEIVVVGTRNSPGEAYVFVRSGTTWSQQQKLTASDGVGNDFFGNAVTISGDTIVVGAYLDDVGTTTDQGSAYVFVRSGTTWSQQQKLTASDGAANDYFGYSVAISGETVVIGAYEDDIGASNQGSAYVFVRSGTTWSQQQKLTASDGATNSRFGSAVAISGETALVGSYTRGAGQGSTYIFVRSGSAWSQEQNLIASDGAGGDHFGVSVAISGGTAVVGAQRDDGTAVDQGAAYIFTAPTCTAPTITDQPDPVTVCAGASASFSVTATGTSLSYQWYKDGNLLTNSGNISGADTATLTINPVATGDAGSYNVIVLEACGASAAPGPALLTVNSFTLSRTSQYFNQYGGNDQVSVTAAAGCNWTAVSNAAWITIPGFGGASGSGTFSYNVADNIGGSRRTGTITVAGQTFTVTQDGTPCLTSITPTDTFVAPSGGSGSFSVSAPAGCQWTATTYFSSAFITLTGNTSGTGNGTVSYSVAANPNSTSRQGGIVLNGAGFSIAQLGTGADCGVTPTSIGQTVSGSLTADDCFGAVNGQPFRADRYSFSGTAGQQIALSVVSADLSPGVFLIGPDGNLIDQFSSYITHNARLPVGSGHLTLPSNGTYIVELIATEFDLTGGYALSIAQRGCVDSLSNLFYFNQNAGTGVANVFAPAGCNWTATSNAAFITVTSGGSGTGNSSVNFTVAANTSNSLRMGSITVGGEFIVITQYGDGSCFPAAPLRSGMPVSSTVSSPDCGSPHYGNNYRAERYTFNGAPGQQITLALTTTDRIDLSLYSPNHEHLLSTNSGGVNTQLQTTLAAAGTYFVELAGWHFQLPGNYTLTLTGCAPPVVTTQPVNQTVCATNNATFTAAASGDPAPTVQWQVSTDNGANFTDLAGATNVSLTLNSVTTVMNGNQYRTVFTNSCAPGTATSNAATLMVNSLTISPAAVPDGVVGSAYSQTFTATGGTGPYTFAVEIGSSLPPGLSLVGGTLSGTPTQAGSSTFAITATANGCASSRTYTLNTGFVNLQATGGEGRVDLNWTQTGFSSVNAFKLYRAPNASGPYTLVNGTLVANQNAISDTSVTPNTAYWYKLAVIRADGVESSFSNAATATPVDIVAPVITHTPVGSPLPANVAIPVTATVTDNTAVQSVKLLFRTTGGSSYTERAMTASGNVYSTSLSANEAVAPGLDYYLEASDGISVTRSGQSDNPHRITIVDRPFIDGLSPASGATAGGTSITLTGRNFKANPVVRFDNAIATITSATATQIVCTTPPHFPATVDVRVTNADGASDMRVGGFTYTGTAAALSLPLNAAGPQNVRVQIPVSVTGVQGLTAVELRVTFNSAILSAVSAARGTLTPNWNLETNVSTPGEVRLALASTGGPVSGSGTLAVIEFDVPGTPGNTSPLTFAAVTLNDGAISETHTNGQFTVAPVYSIAGTVRQWFTNLGLGNVALALNEQGGTRSYAATSQANGTYTVSSVLGGNYTLTPSKSDEVAGITANDAVKVLLHTIGITPLNGHARTAADVNRNGTANTQDAFLILQHVVGLIGLPFPGAGQVWIFEQPTRSYTNLNSTQTGQDFTGILLGDVTGNFVQPNTPTSPGTLAALSLPGATLLPNSQSTLLLGLDLPQGQMLSGELRINYDPTVLSIVGVESGALVSDWLQAFNTNTPGVLRVALAGSRAVTTGGELLRLTVQTTGAQGVSTALTIAEGKLNDGGIGTRLLPGVVATTGSTTALLVSGITPASGPTSGGTAVTISGANFTPNTTVSIGGVAATHVVYVNANTLRATTGAHAAGLADIVVTRAANDSNSLARGFSYSNGGVCQAALSASTQRFPASGGNGSVQVTIGSGCSWDAVSHSDWITLSKASGMGNGLVEFTVARNTGPERKGWMTIAGQTVVITQGVKNASADFDGDGRTDLAVWRGPAGNWLILRSTNSALQSVNWGTSNAPYEDLIVPADYDGDGKADTAVWRQSDGTWYIVNSATGTTTAQAWGTRGDVPVPGDYDGDSKADLAVWRPGDGRWYVRRSSDGGYLIEAWGTAGDAPVVGDYDGDGRADLAIWRPGNGTWYIKRSSGGTQATAWGAGYAPYFDMPVPADYDGDGKTDMAIWRGADSLWYIRRSSDGQPSVKLWGANYAPYHDVPVPGDYDGDGKADIAVWRPSAGAWYVLRSSNGTYLIQSHGQAGDTPVSAVR